MINFVGKKKIFFIISTVLIVGIFLFALIGGVEMDIQFRGGSLITLSYQGEVDHSEFQAAAEKLLGDKISLQEQEDSQTKAKNLVVTTAQATGVDTDQLNAMVDSLNEQFPEAQFAVEEIDTVNPTIGREFFIKCLVAVAFASLLMIVYIALRFRKIGGWSAGAMSVLALLHDVVVVFGVFVIGGIPLNENFIAVVLTILGYSINATIVIYDRVRENRRIYGKKVPLAELVNKSINQSLRRSVNTTISTVIALGVVCVVAYIYQVNSIITFALPLIVGMISGLYSSLCIAGPLWVTWQEHKMAKKAN